MMDVAPSTAVAASPAAPMPPSHPPHDAQGNLYPALKPLIPPKLHRTRPELRLVELQPARALGDRIVCRFVKAGLNDMQAPVVDGGEAGNSSNSSNSSNSNNHHNNQPEFVAISALAGAPDEVETITITNNGPNGRVASVCVSANVGQALRHVRSILPEPAKPRTGSGDAGGGSNEKGAGQGHQSMYGQIAAQANTVNINNNSANPHHRPDQPPSPASYNNTLRVWIDALCIDRQNPREARTLQSHMRSAYQAATLVIGWLGPSPPDKAALLVGVLRDIEAAFPPHFGEAGHRVRHPDHYAPTHSWMRPIAHVWDGPRGDPGAVQDGAYYEALFDLVTRPYLHRTWVLDELARARRPAFQFGERIVSWRQVLQLNRLVEELRDHPSDVFPEAMKPLLVADWPLPLGTTHTLLREYETQQLAEWSDPDE